jgi:hypothetical protein
MWGNQLWMIDHAITQVPGSTLIEPVFRVQEKVEKFTKSLLRITHPFYDLIAICFGMFSEYGLPQIHTLIYLILLLA